MSRHEPFKAHYKLLVENSQAKGEEARGYMEEEEEGRAGAPPVPVAGKLPPWIAAPWPCCHLVELAQRHVGASPTSSRFRLN